MDKVYKVGIMGTANIARRSLIPTFVSSDRFEVYAIASRSMEKAKELSEQCGAGVAYGNYQDLCDDSQIDLIYCPLPTGLHFEWIMKALKSGKHVMSEKSLGRNFTEVSQMVDLARRQNLLLIENFQFRFHSQNIWARKLLESGTLGDVRCFRAQFGFPPFPDGEDNIRYKAALGGGALLDAGAYTLKAMQFLLPDHDFKLKAASLFTPKGMEVDIHGGIYLDSALGVTAELAFGFDNFYQCGYEIWCSKGRLTTNRAFTAPANYNPVMFVERQGERQEVTLPCDNHFSNMVSHIAKCIDTKNHEEEYQQDLLQSKYITEVQQYVYGK
jgi:NDP-hexose-3-ketoreductase